MGYIGNQTSNSYSSIAKQTITGDGGTGYTLDHAVANAQEIEVFVNNVRQEPAVAYTVSGTALTMTGNVAASDDFYVVFQGKALQTTVPPDDSVTTARINDGAVTTAKLDTPIGIETTSSTFKMTDLTSNAFYRESTWTPFITTSGTTNVYEDDAVSSYDTQVGRYVRIGDLVVASFYIAVNSSATLQNGAANGEVSAIAGFPFAIANYTNYFPTLNIGYIKNMNSATTFNAGSNWDGSGYGYQFLGYGQTDKSYFRMAFVYLNGSSDLSVGYLGNGTAGFAISGTVSYITDEA
jgi:hypothetical protein